MAVQFALRPRIRLDQAPAPRRQLTGLRVHPLVLPIGLYWLAITGVAHAVIELTQHPAATTVATDQGAASLPPAPLLQETASETPLSNAAPAPDDAPSPAPAIQEAAPSRAAVSVDAVARDSEPSTAFTAPAEPELARIREPRPRATDTSARPEPAPPLAREQPAPVEREISEAPPEQRPLRRPDRSDDPPPRSSLPSCEAAAESAQQTIDFRGARGAPDLTRGALAAVLENGAYLNGCAIPARTAIEICAAVQDGKVVGVSVRAQPQDSAISD